MLYKWLDFTIDIIVYLYLSGSLQSVGQDMSLPKNGVILKINFKILSIMRNLQFQAGLAGVGTFVAFTVIYLLAFCFSS